MKKMFFNILKKIILTFIVMIFLLGAGVTFADDIDDDVDIDELGEVLQASGEVINLPQINSRASIVYDRVSGTVIFEKNMDERRAIASTTNVISYQR